ncbi:MAG: glycosyltransferase family 4 protein [Methanophagales archaeon]|nr:glycosyltransferase family 4 protein [Methanophagales archaeon]
MRICLVGDFSENLDEGFKNITFRIAKELSDHHRIMKLNIKKIFSTDFWKDVRTFPNPQIVHYLTAPTLRSFVVLKILGFYWRDAKTITSALHPNLSSFSKKIVSLVKPDLILTQSYESDRMFRDLGCRTGFLSNGVNIKKFVPVTKNAKERLREKYGIDRDKFVVLHVGHLMKRRNLQVFDRIQSENNQVVIIGSKYMRTDQKIYQHLKKIGGIVYLGYLKNIEEMYALSNCYIFPVIKGGSILTPLSVMEAMSCNLPVITRDFDGLTRIFSEGDGLIFAKKDEDFINAIDTIKKGLEVKTREKIMPYSWKNIGMELDEIYSKILKSKEVSGIER